MSEGAPAGRPPSALSNTIAQQFLTTVALPEPVLAAQQLTIAAAAAARQLPLAESLTYAPSPQLAL